MSLSAIEGGWKDQIDLRSAPVLYPQRGRVIFNGLGLVVDVEVGKRQRGHCG